MRTRGGEKEGFVEKMENRKIVKEKP